MAVHMCLESGSAVLRIANPPLNLIDQQMRSDMMAALDWAERQDVDRVVITGEGRAFVAGADAKEFGTAPVAPHLPNILHRIENFPVPVVAAINGTALGGGLEIALSCHYRVAAPKAQMGLVEVNLGIIPGAGGTQRLPRLVGMAHALDMIPQAKTLGTEAALSIGLIDGVDDDVVASALAVERHILETALPSGRRAPPEADPDMIAAAHDRARRKAKGIDAAKIAIDLIAGTSDVPLKDGLAREREEFLRLRQSEQAAALSYVFFAERRAISGSPYRKMETQQIDTAVVVGGGNMGACIAYALALVGIRVSIVELDDTGVARAHENIKNLIANAVQRKRLTSAGAENLSKHLSVVAGYDDLPPAQLAIEAVVENMEIKKSVFASLEAALPESAILATNTSYLNIDEIAETIADPSRVIGLHFFNPAHIMKLLEIIKGAHTSDKILASAFKLAGALKKIPVLARNCDGFIGNRILASYRHSADIMLLEGTLPWEVDAAMRDFGFAMGPYEVQDLAGLDIAYANRQRQRLPEDHSMRFVPLVEKLVETHGRLGRKTAAGWYDYARDEGQTASSEVEQLIVETSTELGIIRRAFSPSEIQQRILLAMIDEASAILQEGIAARPSDIDLTMLHGYGFPRWRGGLMHYADAIGSTEILGQIMELQSQDPLSWQPTDLLLRLAKSDQPFATLNIIEHKDPTHG